MNYDRRHVEAVKRRHHVHCFPFLGLFIFLAILAFVLIVIFR